MRFSASILLISVALATITSAAPLVAIVDISTAPTASNLCSECTSLDQSALNALVKASADHYADIAQVRLNDLMREMETAKVTSGSTELPKEKATLTITVQSRIDDAKKACDSDALAPSILAAITADANLNIPWSKHDQAEKKIDDLNAAIEKIVLDRIQAHVNAELLSKDITENMTNTAITPIPETAAPVPEAPAAGSETQAPVQPNVLPGTSAPAPAPAPEVVAPAPEVVPQAPQEPVVAPETSPPAEEQPKQIDAVKDINSGTQAGIDVAGTVDPKFLCSSGCKDAKDASTVLALRVNLERQLAPRLQYFYTEEIPVACSESRSSLWDIVRNLLNGLSIEAIVKTSK
ncbi:hypothetical protein BGZ72_010471 [Mortierella alpina]|nr:hypothetical protein BGZ72_010471 [Mortierella alpina]